MLVMRSSRGIGEGRGPGLSSEVLQHLVGSERRGQTRKGDREETTGRVEDNCVCTLGVPKAECLSDRENDQLCWVRSGKLRQKT